MLSRPSDWLDGIEGRTNFIHENLINKPIHSLKLKMQDIDYGAIIVTSGAHPISFLGSGPNQGHPGARTRGGSTPNFESNKIDSPTKVLSVCLSPYLSSCVSVCRFAFLPALQLFLSSYFLSFPLLPFSFLGDFQFNAIYSPTPKGSTRPPLTPFPDATGPICLFVHLYIHTSKPAIQLGQPAQPEG